MNLAHCIGCGCHDYAACVDEATGEPCSWLAVDYQAKRGVCSACPGDLARWNAGSREISVPVDVGSRSHVGCGPNSAACDADPASQEPLHVAGAPSV